MADILSTKATPTSPRLGALEQRPVNASRPAPTQLCQLGDGPTQGRLKSPRRAPSLSVSNEPRDGSCEDLGTQITTRRPLVRKVYKQHRSCGANASDGAVAWKQRQATMLEMAEPGRMGGSHGGPGPIQRSPPSTRGDKCCDTPSSEL